jgi:Holliday junction resolvase RusA-like endonuclease
MKLVIPGELPTLNEIISASKRHHMQYSNLKGIYTNLVCRHAQAQNTPKFERINVVITWYCKDKRKDKDNIATGQKFIFDGLVKAGVLDNDGWSQIGDVTHKFEVDKHKPRIEIKLTETG